MNKKIVICLNTSWNIYNFRLNLARTLKDIGYEVILIAPYDKYSEILKQEFEYHDLYINNKGTNPIEDLKTLLELYKLYKNIKPDIVLNYTIKPNIYGNIACSLLGIKTINNISGLGTVFIRESIITKIVNWLYKYSLGKSSKVFFQNNDDKELFIMNKLVQKDKCDLLPGSGIDTNKFIPIEFKKEDETFRFLLIARMLWDKGVGEYVEASKILRNENIEFGLLGYLDVSNPSAIQKEQMSIWEKDSLIKYYGSTDDVKKFIIQTDCVVLPSYREGISMTLMESASLSKPLIATNVPGCKDLIDDEINGFLCEVKNSQDLANKMQKMINLNLNQRIAMGIAGREKMIKEFDESIVIAKYLETILPLQK